jgi:predicted Zn-dependent protease
MRSLKLILALTLSIACTAPAAGQIPDVFKRNAEKAKKVSDAMAPWTAEQEKAIGEASAAKLIHMFGLYDNPDMAHYVSTVGHAVAQNAGRQMEWKFGILNTESVNALAMPGGYVFITRGALANMKSEAELAGVLGHEVAHVDNRHLEKQIRAKQGTGMAMQEIGDRLPGPAVLKDLANNVVTNALTMQYTRDKESEADSKGTDLSAQAGYDSAGLKHFLETLKAAEDADPDNTKKSLGLWGSTHPPLGDRIADLTPHVTRYSGGQTLEERFAKNASFGPTEEELKKAAEEKAATEKADAEKKAAAEKKTATPKKTTTKKK